MTKSILLVGVGGQGTILASKILTTGLLAAGYDVKMSEIHGMSQRGGSVSSHVRYGEDVQSPVIDQGGADILIAFEKVEAMRWISYLKPDGKLVVNDEEIPSLSVIIGDQDYPENVLPRLEAAVSTRVVPAAKMAAELGNSRVANIILLGTIVKLMDLTHIDWETILKQNIKPQFVEINLQAFQKGMESV